MEQPAALFFDLDETLLDGNSSVDESIARACAEVVAAQPALHAETLLKVNREVFSAYWAEVEDKFYRGLLGGAAVSLEAWRRTLRACGCNDEGLAELAVEALGRHAEQSYTLFEDALPVLERLHGRLPLAIITNGAIDTQWGKLRATGVHEYFDAVIVFGEVGVAKPDSAIFQLAMAALGVAPDYVWHVGDSLESDVAGARNACLTAVWLNRNGATRSPEHPEPHVEIRSLTELLEYIEL